MGIYTDMTVNELFDRLADLKDEFGSCEVRVSYDSGVVATPIKKKTPLLKDGTIYFEGY